MKKYLVLLIILIFTITACNKRGEEEIILDENGNTNAPTPTTPPNNNTPTGKPTAYDWGFYLIPYRLNAVKQEKDLELKKLYYQIYGTPSGEWYDGIASNSDNRLKNLLNDAEKAQKTPIVVIYGIPNRDCGSFSKGGHTNSTNYKAWIDRISNFIGQKRVVVIIEPDAINYCGWKNDSAERKERAELLTYVGKTLSEKNPNAATYIHAGSAAMNTNSVANAIIEGGVQYMRGFAFNVSGVGGTKEEQEGAEKLVKRLEELGIKGKHYVIDTGRSGINRPKNPHPNAAYNSCNNFAAALGPRSTKNTTGAHADAYLWINGGGGSDGDCGMGGPPAGQPYPAYTKALVENALRVGSIKLLELPSDLQ